MAIHVRGAASTRQNDAAEPDANTIEKYQKRNAYGKVS